MSLLFTSLDTLVQLFNCLLMQISSESPSAFRHADMVKTIC